METVSLYIRNLDKGLHLRIKQEAKPPTKKYFKPAPVDCTEVLLIEDKIYNEKDCSSIEIYKNNKSKEDIKQEAPNRLNKIIRG